MKPGASDCSFLCLECAKTHLRASIGQQIFLGALPPDPQGSGRDKGRERRGRGREGNGRAGEGGEDSEREGQGPHE